MTGPTPSHLPALSPRKKSDSKTRRDKAQIFGKTEETESPTLIKRAMISLDPWLRTYDGEEEAPSPPLARGSNSVDLYKRRAQASDLNFGVAPLRQVCSHEPRVRIGDREAAVDRLPGDRQPYCVICLVPFTTRIPGPVVPWSVGQTS